MNDIKNNDPDDREQTGIEAETGYQGEKRGFTTVLAPHITIAVAMIVLATVAWWGLSMILPLSGEQLEKPQSALTKQLTPEEAELGSYLTSSLKLTAEEAKNFWPVYNEYTDKRDKLNQDKNSLLETITLNFENLTREEFTEAGDRVIDISNQEARLAAEYHIIFGKVLAPEKVILLYSAEMQFKTLLLNQLQESRE